ncbi:MAG: c-type cytochrome domain-containing protein [Rhodothermales bacterium]|nr:c-type cytochrome domain-containing protein [Rhodothermales bacterium]
MGVLLAFVVLVATTGAPIPSAAAPAVLLQEADAGQEAVEEAVEEPVEEPAEEAGPESPTPLVTRLLDIDPENPADGIVFAGRFHPLLVHMPIGLLLLAFLMEFLSRAKRFADLKPAVSFTLFLGAVSAVFTVVAGLLLAASGDYGGDDLWWHKWLGIGVAVLSVVAYFFKRKTLSATPTPRARSLYAGSLVASVLVLTVASHFGGSLTHGEDYFTSYMPEPFRSLAGIPPREQPDAQIVIENIDEAVLFTDIVHPIMDARCISCHNSKKEEGELLLTTPAEIMEGGENGIILTAGDAANSELYRRITLEEAHDDHMPPSGRRPLTDDQIALIGWWIDSGASFDQKVAQVEVPARVMTILERLTEKEDESLAIQVPPADPQALEALAAYGVLAMPLSVETNLLQIQAINVRDRFGDEQMALLEPVAEQIAWLNLGNTPLTDAGLAAVAGFTNLSRLHLEKTKVTDAGLAHLVDLNYLSYLNLYGTAVSDAGLAHLEALNNLKSLYLWESNVTAAGADSLRSALPEVDINMGWEMTSASEQTPPAGSATE